MQPNQTLSDLTARCLQMLSATIAETKPDCIVGQGDTTTALCASMAAFYARIPFVHVEAGLRTDSIDSPFPEEFNRRVCSLTTALHCAPTEAARQNLLREGYSSDDRDRHRQHGAGRAADCRAAGTTELMRRGCRSIRTLRVGRWC